MALNDFMHPRNPYKNKKPDFKRLSDKYEKFKVHTSVDSKGKVHIDFKNSECLRALTWVLLKDGFDLDVDMPIDRLIPTIPLRLNYLLWIEDILDKTTQVNGIDIGCGASCVYPLLGARKNGWKFIATEVDATNATYALRNVEHNGLTSSIQVVKVREDMTLLDVVQDLSYTTLAFCMCNPPFYGSNLEAWGMLSSRSEDRPEPNSINTASPVECIVPGGEVQYVKQIIESSVELKTQIRVYTSMLGKKSSLPVLKKALKANGVPNIGTTEFCQGKTMRWGLGWSFDNTVVFPKPTSKQVQKAKPPLVYKLPPKYDGLSSSFTIDSICSVMEDILKDLQVIFNREIDEVSKKQWEIMCVENTWSHQRRKKRMMLRDDKCSSNSTNHDDCEPDIPKKRSKIKYGDGNEIDNSEVRGNHSESIEVLAEVSPVDGIDLSNNDSKTSKLTTVEISNSSHLCDSAVIGLTHNDNPTCHTVDEATHGGNPTCHTVDEATHGDNPTCHTVDEEMTFLFKSNVTLKTVDNRMLMEFEWIEGQNREHLHQLLQYFKNKLI